MESAELNLADLIILVVVGLACIHGLFRGLVRMLLWLATLAAAVTAVWLYVDSFAFFLQDLISDATLRTAVAFLSIFVGVLLLGNWIIARWLAGVLSLAGLTLMDRILGGLFGILWGVVIVCVALLVLSPFLGTLNFWNESLFVQLGLELISRLPSVFSLSGDLVVI